MLTLEYSIHHCQCFQVCFKHPDLLKQAREACVAKRVESSRSKRKNTSRIDNDRSKISKASNTNEELDEPKMCKIQFREEIPETEESDEEFADIVPLPSCSRSVPMIMAANSANNSVKVKFRLESISDQDSDELFETNQSEEFEGRFVQNNDEELHRKLSEIFGPDVINENSLESTESSNSSTNFQFSIQRSPSKKVMKIHYQDYYKRILTAEMKALMHQSYLNDVQFICTDGVVNANSLLLGKYRVHLHLLNLYSITFLREVLLNRAQRSKSPNLLQQRAL